MLTDIDIARQAEIRPIGEIAEKIGLTSDDLDLYGKYKAKIPMDVLKRNESSKDGKLVLVTAMNPTPAGEGKTTVSIGLAQALAKIGLKTLLALREPSLGPVFGIKGGAAGGGYSQLIPMDDINLHFTGDLHAITSANNLLAAMIDNHIYQGNELNIDKDKVLWKRCMDMNDRALRNIEIGVGGGTNGIERDDSFSITAASEIMATLCMASDIEDLTERIKNIAVAYDTNGNIVTAGMLGAEGSLTVLLKDAICPNLVQTLEHVPALVHGGPFANISHGCNSLIATKAGLKMTDILVTEAGFGADLGAFKFLDLKCRAAGIWPDVVVIVSTVRSLKYNAGIPKEELTKPDVDAVRRGFPNLAKHIENMTAFGIPVVVASNRFLSDTDEEIAEMKRLCEEMGAKYAPAEVFAKGGEGGIELASEVAAILDQNKPKKPVFTYELKDSIEEKIRKVATKIYGAKDIEILPEAAAKIAEFTASGYGELPICVAKTQYSLSDDAKALGRPEGFTLTVRDVRLSTGAGYMVILTGKILTMPGLPKHPAALDISIDKNGDIHGLF